MSKQGRIAVSWYLVGVFFGVFLGMGIILYFQESPGYAYNRGWSDCQAVGPPYTILYKQNAACIYTASLWPSYFPLDSTDTLYAITALYDKDSCLIGVRGNVISYPSDPTDTMPAVDEWMMYGSFTTDVWQNSILGTLTRVTTPYIKSLGVLVCRETAYLKPAMEQDSMIICTVSVELLKNLYRVSPLPLHSDSIDTMPAVDPDTMTHIKILYADTLPAAGHREDEE